MVIAHAAAPRARAVIASSRASSRALAARISSSSSGADISAAWCSRRRPARLLSLYKRSMPVSAPRIFARRFALAPCARRFAPPRRRARLFCSPVPHLCRRAIAASAACAASALLDEHAARGAQALPSRAARRRRRTARRGGTPSFLRALLLAAASRALLEWASRSAARSAPPRARALPELLAVIF